MRRPRPSRLAMDRKMMLLASLLMATAAGTSHGRIVASSENVLRPKYTTKRHKLFQWQQQRQKKKRSKPGVSEIIFLIISLI